MIVDDWIGGIGVGILLAAFILNLSNKISKRGAVYLLMNFPGSALATIASYLIHYAPFIILVGAWMLASLYGMWQNYILENQEKS